MTTKLFSSVFVIGVMTAAVQLGCNSGSGQSPISSEGGSSSSNNSAGGNTSSSNKDSSSSGGSSQQGGTSAQSAGGSGSSTKTTTSSAGGSDSAGGDSGSGNGGTDAAGGTSSGATNAGGKTTVNAGGKTSTSAGGKTSSGGTVSTGVGGKSSAGGASSPSGGTSSTSSATTATGNCTITPTGSVSTTIKTVGIVEFTSSLSTIDSANIEFGLDTSYGLTAPVDLKAAKYKTLVLGMKENKTYHYRVVAKSGSTQCTSSDGTFTTGTRPSALSKPKLNTKDAKSLAGGYLVCETYVVASASSNGIAFILDKDGDFVWWYEPKIGDLTVTRQSYDGKTMWIGHGNVPQGTGKVVNVGMDGSNAKDNSSEFTGMNHDLIVLPDETVGFIAYGSGGCDDVKERSPSGSVKKIINAGDVFGDGQPCHANAIKYSKDDDSYVVSELDHDAYFKVDRQGKVAWVLGGKVKNTFTGAGATWDNEHNLHILGKDRLLIFNNGGTGQGSKALELKLDLTAKTSTVDWQYAASPSISNNVMGDVQRLDNGNTLVVYSTQGIIHEVNASGTLLQELAWDLGGAIGYCEKRASLYGPPPR